MGVRFWTSAWIFMVDGVTYNFGGTGICDGGEENGNDTSGPHIDCYALLLVDWLIRKFDVLFD
jgi:hypothetical protein